MVKSCRQWQASPIFIKTLNSFTLACFSCFRLCSQAVAITQIIELKFSKFHRVMANSKFPAVVCWKHDSLIL